MKAFGEARPLKRAATAKRMATSRPGRDKCRRRYKHEPDQALKMEKQIPACGRQASPRDKYPMGARGFRMTASAEARLSSRM